MFRVVLLLSITSVAWPQTRVPFQPFQPPLIQLKEYLQLTDSQYSMLFQNIGEHQQAIAERQQRIATVQRQITLETARENPDPTELGTRYAEIEFICRAVNDDAKRLQDRNRALLTDAQKARLKTLEDAWKLYATISQAQQVLLLDGSAGYASFLPGLGSGSITVPTASVRSGDFIPGCSARPPLVFTP
jgi:hypothetical protein